MFELLFADEVHEPPESLLGLAGEADDERGPKGHLWHTEPNTTQQSAERVTGAFSPHRTKYYIIGVLQRHINILDHLRQLGHGFQQRVSDQIRIAVQQTNPAKSLNSIQFCEQLREGTPRR